MFGSKCGIKIYIPTEPDNFLLNIQAFFGPKGSKGSESFDFTLCTPKALEEKFRNEVVFIRHYIIVSSFDYNKLVASFEKLANSVSGKDWHEIATQLSRYGYWEFEDYRP